MTGNIRLGVAITDKSRFFNLFSSFSCPGGIEAKETKDEKRTEKKKKKRKARKRQKKKRKEKKKEKKS